jgi:hypothetical protein
LGWGPENYLIAWGRYFDSASGVVERFDQAHNKLVEEVVTKGTIGAVSYAILWGTMAGFTIRAIKRRQRYEQVFVVFVGAALAGFFIQNLFLFDSPVTSLQFAVLVAFVASEEMWLLRSVAREEHQNKRPGRQVSGFMAFDSAIMRASGEWFRTPVGLTVAAVASAAIVSASLVFFNVRAFAAASAVVQTSDPQISWEERFALFEESIGDFPSLANYPRLLLMSQVSNNIGTLSLEELNLALDMIEREGVEALKSEPENWRIHLSMARFYQLISQAEPSFLEVAREHLDEGLRLAPRTVDANSTRMEQERLESARSN